MSSTTSSSTGPSNSRANDNNRENAPFMTRIKNQGLSCIVSMQEGLSHAKATLLGQVQKMAAKNEKEATEADLRAAKMQVEATTAAENTRKRLET